MKKIIGIFILGFSFNVFSESGSLETCKIYAQNAKSISEDKNAGLTEFQIRESIFKKNSDIKKAKHKYVKDEVVDRLTAKEIEYLIWIFDKKNSGLSPDQVYSYKFNECFQYFNSK